MSKHLLEVERNAEGHSLAILCPINPDGKVTSGYRIAGPKAWGGSTNLAKLEITSDDLAAYIKNYAPDVLEKLAAS